MAPLSPVRVAVFDVDGTLLPFGDDRYRVLDPAIVENLQRLQQTWNVRALTGGELTRTLFVVGAIDPGLLRTADREPAGWQNTVVDPGRNWLHLHTSGGREELPTGATRAETSPLIRRSDADLQRFVAPFMRRLQRLGATINRKSGIVEIDHAWLGETESREVATVVAAMEQTLSENSEAAASVTVYRPSSDPTSIEFHAIPMRDGKAVSLDKGTVLTSIYQTTSADEMLFFCDDLIDVAGALVLRRLVDDGHVRGGVVVVESGKTPPELRRLADWNPRTPAERDRLIAAVAERGLAGLPPSLQKPPPARPGSQAPEVAM